MSTSQFKPVRIVPFQFFRGRVRAYSCQGAPARDTGRPAPRKTASEVEYNHRFCATVNGETETRHGYAHAGGRSYVKVDCETNTTVYEGGLDKRSSLDSLQQALFFSVLTGKRPAVVIYDTDGKEGRLRESGL